MSPAANMPNSTPSTNCLADAKLYALWGVFVGDAIGMPVHWYRDTEEIFGIFGHWINGYESPRDTPPIPEFQLPPDCVDVVGSVILHNKQEQWTKNAKYIHKVLKAGENTLTALLAYRSINTMRKTDNQVQQPDSDVREKVVGDYVDFMTTPGEFNHVYAEYFHLAFFRDWAKKGKPREAKDLEKFMLTRKPIESLLTIDCIPLIVPWIVRNANKPQEECITSVLDFLKVTHPSENLKPYVVAYTVVLHSVLNGKSLIKAAQKAMDDPLFSRKRAMFLWELEKARAASNSKTTLLTSAQTSVAKLGSSHYIEGALSCVFFLAVVFAKDVVQGLTVNANCGGDTIHRGMALGALLGANFKENGKDWLNRAKPLVEDLKMNKDIQAVITPFVHADVGNNRDTKTAT